MRPRLKNHPLGTYSLIYYTNSTFNVSRIVELKSFDIHYTSFPHEYYKLLPDHKNILGGRRFFFLFVCFFHFHRTLFRGHAGACVNPESFFKLSFCAFISLSNNSLIS